MSNGEAFKDAATHPLLAIVFSIIFAAFSNIQGFNIPQIAQFAFEASVLMLLAQIAIGAAYGLQSDADGISYIIGTIFGVYLILNSSLKMDIFGWIGAIGAILLTSCVLIKKRR